MATEIILPHLGESIIEATLVTWFKRIGDDVKRGEELADVETDKATMPLECPVDGVVLAILVEEGAEVRTGQLLAVIGQSGEEWTEEMKDIPSASTETEIPLPTARTAKEPTVDQARRVSPGARRMADKLGIPIDQVQPHVKGARITTADVKRYAAELKVQSTSSIPSHRIELNRVRSVVAKRMLESAQTVPQFSVTMQVDATQFMSAQKQLTAVYSAQVDKVSITALLVYLTARAIKEHPTINAVYDGDGVIIFDTLNIAVAVATRDGLMVPVVHGVENLRLVEIAERVNDLAILARQGKLTIENVANPTFTISNLGVFGVSQFVALVNPPQAAILALGAAHPGFLPDDQGKPLQAQLIDMTVTADHRVLDGADVSAFLATVKNMVEQCQVDDFR